MQIYLREDGRDRTNRLSTFHAEIAKPADRLPTAQGCMAALPSAAQVVFTNAAVSAMLAAFYAWRRGKLDYEEAYLDIVQGRTLPVRRAVRGAYAFPASRKRAS